MDLLNSNTDLNYSNIGFIPNLIQKRRLKKTINELTACKKPILNVGKKKKEYEKCLSDYKLAKQNIEKELNEAKIKLQESNSAKKELELVKAQLAELSASKSNQSDSAYKQINESDSDKILGMPKGLAIGLGVLLGVAVIGGGAYLILKNK